MARIDDLKYQFREDEENPDLLAKLIQECFARGNHGPDVDYINNRLRGLQKSHPEVVRLALEKISEDHQRRVENVIRRQPVFRDDVDSVDEEESHPLEGSGALKSRVIRPEDVNKEGIFRPFRGLRS